MDEQTDKLPPGWALTDVATAGDVRLGRQRSPDKQTGRYPCPYLRAANITPDGINIDELFEMDFTPAEREIFSLKVGDVVLTEASGSSTHVGRAAIWRGEIAECCYQNTVIRFRPRIITPEYALTVFRYYSTSGKFADTARGVGIQHLSAKRFARMKLPLAPLAEQRRIAAEVNRRTREIREAKAALLSALTNIAKQNKQILAAAVAGEIVESEAVLAEREGRTFESGESLLLRIASADQTTIFEPTAGDESQQIDHHPSGWGWTEIGTAGEVSLGKARAPQHQYGPHMRPYLRVANVYEDRIDTSSILKMNFPPSEYAKYSLRYGDILLNDGQSPEFVGRPAMYRDEVPGACFQNHLIRFRASEAVVPEFALIVFRHYLHSGVFKAAARWTTNIATLSRRRFSSLPMPVPPLEEQRRIVKETRRRLKISSAQEADVRAALERLPGMERELLAAAVQGALAPQAEGDESASELLSRSEPITVEVSEPSEVSEPEAYSPRGLNVDMSSEDRVVPTASILAETIRDAGRPLQIPELFTMAGYDRDSTEDVEQFYLVLRDEMGRSLRRVGESSENDLLEAMDSAIE
jgi:type I restriction enzyme S subunit